GFIVGLIIGLLTSPPRRLIAAVVAFGSGVLVSALTFELMLEAFEKGSAPYVVAGFLLGATIYVAIDTLLERMAARSPRRTGRDAQDVEPGAHAIPESQEAATISGTALLVGTVLDGIPENAAIGISLRAEGEGLGLVLMAAVFLSNLPATISSAVGMRQEGRSRAYIIAVWGVVAVACTLSAIGGYALLRGLSPDMIAAMLALAAGGILAMLADTMMPEAFENGGPVVAMATAVGFLCAFLLSHYVGH
ncbi:MAG: Integral membrane protein, partial [uncultured Solirubrobacteraceae bacterium]